MSAAMSIQDQISATIVAILQGAASELNCELPTQVPLDRPKNRDHGDYATSIALALAKPSGKSPRDIAEIIKAGLEKKAEISKVEIAGPGFINITLAKASQGAVIAQI